MSERPTQTQTSSATEADRLRLDARAGRSGAYQGMAAGQSLADRAAQFRNGAPFLVERATLYDPDPLEPQEQGFPDLPPARSVLPAALTLLGVVVTVGLVAGVIFVRNADAPREDELAGRIEQFSEPALPPRNDESSGRWDTVPYDLKRRPTDTIVGAWRPGKTAATEPARDSETVTPPLKQSDAPRRRPMPQRVGSLPPAERTAPQPAPPVAQTEPATPPAAEIVTVAPAPVPAAPTAAPPTVSTAAPAPAEVPVSPPAVAEKAAPNVVARVGRTSDPVVAEPREPEGRTAPRPRHVDDDDDDDARSRGHANRMSLNRYRRWRAERARRRANRPDPYDAILTEKAAQGIRFYGVHRNSP